MRARNLALPVVLAASLAAGVGGTAWNFTSYDLVMNASSGVAVSYPPVDSSDWFVSGFERGASELGGTAAVVDQPIGTRRPRRSCGRSARNGPRAGPATSSTM